MLVSVSPSAFPASSSARRLRLVALMLAKRPRPDAVAKEGA